MMKTVLNGANSYIPCSILETYDVGFVTKPKVATWKGFQTQKGPKEPAGGVGSQEQSNEVQRKSVTPIVLSNVGGPMKVEYRPSPALNGNGNTYSIPLFNGIDSREFVSWLYAIECYFGVHDFSEHEKCDMVVSCLRNDALKWYYGVAYTKASNGVFKFKYWHKLKSTLKEIYLNKAVMVDLENEFQNLKMDSLSVKDYTIVFNELYFFCGDPNDSFEKINLFYNGLNSEIQNWINMEQINSFELLCDLALISENLIHKHEAHMESLARENAKHVVSSSKGLGHEVPLSYGLISKDKTTVPMSVLGAELHVAYAQVTELSSEFPWKCWSPKDVIGMSNQHITCLGCRCEPPDLCALSAEALGMNMRPRHFMIIFDPGGIDDVPSLEVHLSKGG